MYLMRLKVFLSPNEFMEKEGLPFPLNISFSKRIPFQPFETDAKLKNERKGVFYLVAIFKV